jgi:probable HAF family extracellular repeat protein
VEFRSFKGFYGTSHASGINNSGVVVGFSDRYYSGGTHAFLWGLPGDGNMHDLGTLGGTNSKAFGINARGDIVGGSDSAFGYYSAFLYKDGAMTDLNNHIGATGWWLQEADAVNDLGQIVGYGINPAGQTHAFLLTPTPEPSALAMLGIGSVGLLALIARKRKGA